jgi:hypothetical protein
MLEAEWLSSGDFRKMLAAVAPSMSLRQSQLLACACLRFLLAGDDGLAAGCRAYIERVEDHADSERVEGAAGALYWGSGYGGELGWQTRRVVGVELRLEGDATGTEMLRELTHGLSFEVAELAVRALFRQEELAWGLEELGATARGAALVAAGLRRFQRPDEGAPL